MGRLTEKNEQGYWSLKGVPWELLTEGTVITKEIREKLYGALCKLKDYEDTGLNPETVMQLQEYSWIPTKYEVPSDDRFVLLSFSNFTTPMIGRYEQDEFGGGAWCLGDCDEQDTCIANDLFVNAWMELPKQYEGGINDEPTTEKETEAEIPG